MELDHNIATDAVVPTDCVEQSKIFTITRDAGTKYEKDVRVVLISKEDLQQAAQNPELNAEKRQQYTTVASAASMRINLFKNMGKKSPLISGFHAEKADYEISVPQPKGNGNTRGGNGIGE